MSAQSPPLTEILTKLGDDWSMVKNRFDRHQSKGYIDDDRWEALHNHPFTSVLERVTVWTGISSEKLREATLKHFDGYSDLVERLWRLDDKGQTRELWELLVKEYSSALLKAGLMQEKPSGQPTGKTGESEGNGGVDTSAEQSAVLDSKAILSGLQPAVRKAYLSYQYAETMAGRTLQDQDAYNRLREYGIDTDKGDLSELADYKLPTYDTWCRQVRNARASLGEQKYTNRGGRVLSKSIVFVREIECRHGNE